MAATDRIQSINPATEEILTSFDPHSPDEIEGALHAAGSAFRHWSRVPFTERASLMKGAATRLRDHSARLSDVMTAEMGKPITESEAEIAKCAWVCDYYAENAEDFLQDSPRDSNATESYVQYTPLGVVLAVMPWNFPFWQVFRFAAPALMAGNTGILKHAANVPQCALAIEEIFRESGFPDGVFRSLLVSGSAVGGMVASPHVAAVTLTGSEAAGSSVALQAGRHLKKSVLELGGSDPFIVLDDADLQAAVRIGVRARYQNTGQSCIAAKRFIVTEKVYGEFTGRFLEEVGALKIGNPVERDTRIGPLARRDLLDDLDRQVQGSVARGAKILTGGSRRNGRGYYFQPTVLADVPLDAPAGCEEVFGPVAALMRVQSSEEALHAANSTTYGLGANLWTEDLQLARRMARRIEAGQVFINGMVASDPRLPFGGVKRSGYGRELSEFGIREFVNIQTVWIGPPRA